MVLWDIFYRIFWTHGGNHVVEVHEHVDEDVEQAEEGGRAARDPPHARPHGQRHDAVVDDVQEADVAELLAGDEAEGVDELGKLAQVVNVGDPHHLKKFQG